MARKVKEPEAGLPKFPTPAELNKEMLEISVSELRHEIKRLRKRNSRVADTYLSAFGFPTSAFPSNDAFETRISSLDAVGVWRAGAVAKHYSTGADGKALPYLYETEKVIGYLAWWKGKCEGLIPCEFPPMGSEILEASSGGRKLILLRGTGGELHVLGEAAIIFPLDSPFAAQKLNEKSNRLVLLRPIPSSEFEELRTGLKLEDSPLKAVHEKDPSHLLKKYRSGTQA